MSTPTLFWQDKESKDGVHGMQLIEFDANNQLVVTESGTKLLNKQKKSRNMNMLFIFGNARSGKSFMMNCLLGVPGLFKVVNSATPCTKGVDVSSLVVPHSTLAHHVGTYGASVPSNDNLDVGFVDVEGQGDKDGTHDTMLALPLLVTSKVVLFNHKGAPTVNDMLSKLGVLARAADYIDLEDSEGKTDEHKKKEGRARGISVHAEGKKFGHLHVLFRDFSFEGTKEDVKEQLMGMEKVVKKVAQSGGNDPAKASKERNDIRGLLNDNFMSINVWLFKQPASADKLRETKELPESLIDPEFIGTVKELLATVTAQLAAPTHFNGNALSGPRLASLVVQVTEQLNKGGAINVPSVFRAMEKEAVLRVAAACLADFTAGTEKLRTRLPMAAKELATLHTTAMATMVRRFDEELSDCVLDLEKAASRTDLEGRGVAALEALARENQDALVVKMKQVIHIKFSEMRNSFEAYCKKHIPMKDLGELEQQFTRAKDGAIAAIHIDLRSLDGATQSPEFEMLLLEGQESLQEFLTLKTMQNESANKDAAITRLREDAIKQQELMIEQNKKLTQYVAEEKAQTVAMEKKLQTMKQERETELKRNEENENRLKKQAQELEELRKKRRACAIL
jgi:hypothetical protein